MAEDMFELIGLKEAPFRLGPDPKYFYHTHGHEKALERLYLSIEQKTGLDIIYGDYGTGKSTIAEILLHKYAARDDFVVGRITNPSVPTVFQFYKLLLDCFGVEPKGRATLNYSRALEQFALDTNLVENKNILLIVDEGESLTPTFVDVLRTILNFETPSRKFIQLTILAQLELIIKMKRKRNFVNRINMSYVLNPLDREETKGLVEYRLRQAGWDGSPTWFPEDTMDVIFQESKGFPRTITSICREGLNQAIIDGEDHIGVESIIPIAKEEARIYGERKAIKI
jgi:type II secretory pathway predicted ATPase ExeA